MGALPNGVGAAAAGSLFEQRKNKLRCESKNFKDGVWHIP
jgi:hypothetical protein